MLDLHGVKLSHGETVDRGPDGGIRVKATSPVTDLGRRCFAALTEAGKLRVLNNPGAWNT